MENINVTYLGLKLSSPIVASSSGLTSKVESIKELEKNGVGAVVLKSLFEEQITNEITHTEQYNDYPEQAEYLNAYIKDNNVSKYLDLIKNAKKECNIPIIASICCVNGGEWTDFAKDIEQAGADALELNIFYMPTSADQSAGDLEKEYINTVNSVVESINIPVSVKISGHFTNPINIAREIYFRKAKGVTMFNRLYDPNIDIENISITNSNIFSNSDELRHSLRWIAISSAAVSELDYSASTGIHSGEDVVKMLLAGASTVQVCSHLYQNGVEEIANMNNFLKNWMQKKGYENISEFKGLLNYKNLEKNVAYERSQFMKYYSSHK